MHSLRYLEIAVWEELWTVLVQTRKKIRHPISPDFISSVTYEVMAETIAG